VGHNCVLQFVQPPPLPEAGSAAATAAERKRVLCAYISPWVTPAACRAAPALARPRATATISAAVRTVPGGYVSRVTVSNDGGPPRLAHSAGE
jgi:hypothetical protein